MAETSSPLHGGREVEKDSDHTQLLFRSGSQALGWYKPCSLWASSPRLIISVNSLTDTRRDVPHQSPRCFQLQGGNEGAKHSYNPTIHPPSICQAREGAARAPKLSCFSKQVIFCSIIRSSELSTLTRQVRNGGTERSKGLSQRQTGWVLGDGSVVKNMFLQRL